MLDEVGFPVGSAGYSSSGPEAPDQQGLPTLAELEAEHVARVYKSTGGNKTRAAEILGIAPRTLNRKLTEYDIEAG